MQLVNVSNFYCYFFSLGYEPPQALSPLPPPAPSPPAWQARALGTARLQLVEFSAFVEPPDAVDSVSDNLGALWKAEGDGKGVKSSAGLVNSPILRISDSLDLLEVGLENSFFLTFLADAVAALGNHTLKSPSVKELEGRG